MKYERHVIQRAPYTHDLYSHIMLQRIPLDVYNVTDPSMQLQYYPRNPIAFKLLLCAEYIDLRDSCILDSVQVRDQNVMSLHSVQ